MRFRVLDIETVPDESVWTPGEAKWKWAPCVPREHDPVGVCEKPRLVVEEVFPPPHACRVVAVAFVDVGLDVEKSPRYSFKAASTDCRWAVFQEPLTDWDMEFSLLSQFAASMSNIEEKVDLVTWNGRGFDLPVISLRSLRLGIACPWYYENRDVRYRFSSEGHLDLMDFLCDYGAARYMKLDDVARSIGLPGKTGSVTGASVHDVYQSTLDKSSDPEFCSEKQAEVGRYCLQDVIQTALIFLRTRFHLGKITRDEYNLCLATFEESPEVRAAIDVDWDAVRLR